MRRRAAAARWRGRRRRRRPVRLTPCRRRAAVSTPLCSQPLRCEQRRRCSLISSLSSAVAARTRSTATATAAATTTVASTARVPWTALQLGHRPCHPALRPSLRVAGWCGCSMGSSCGSQKRRPTPACASSRPRSGWHTRGPTAPRACRRCTHLLRRRRRSPLPPEAIGKVPRSVQAWPGRMLPG